MSERKPAPRAAAAEAMHEEEALGQAYDARLMARLWRFVAPYRGEVALTLVLVFPSFLLELAPAWIVKTGLDHLVGAGRDVAHRALARAAGGPCRSSPGSAGSTWR